MQQDQLINRINELARKSRTEGLTGEEKQEQAQLRNEYLVTFRKQFEQLMESTRIKEPDGTVHAIRRRDAGLS